ncbi:hypothetical protein [Penaeicola halotolerans]|uniref:hypothetical protein n=1 Tax=Penaeicola halotolerans TaxID=2793196 RepID=UPI001CF8A91F|nr:hypothetical protein [Penaeicola halotolerans]
MEGTTDLVDFEGNLFKEVKLTNEGLSIGGISVGKSGGVYVTLDNLDQGFRFNASLSKLESTSPEKLIFKRKRAPKNGVLWKNNNSETIAAKTCIDKGKVIITINRIDDEALLAMILMERIHHARSLLMANTAFL